MSFAPGTRTGWHRRALGELDPNKDLNAPRGLYKREPIVYAQENEITIYQGLQLGIYDWDEVMALTNEMNVSPAASVRDNGGSDEDTARIDMDDGNFSQEDVGSDGFGEAQGDDEELLSDIVPEDLGDGIAEMTDVAENEEHIDAEDHMQDTAFDPAGMGLKEINNLAHFGVSSHKPGNGVAELLSEDLDKYWQ